MIFYEGGSNTMKRKFTVIACLCAMTFAIAACGSSGSHETGSVSSKAESEVNDTSAETSDDQITKEALTGSIEQDGTKIEIHADADEKEDKITSLTQTTTIDTSQYTDDEKQQMDTIVSEAKENFAGVDGVEYSADEKNGIYTETIKMDVKDHLKEVIDAGVLQMKAVNDGEEIEYLSLSSVRESLKEAGWIVD